LIAALLGGCGQAEKGCSDDADCPPGRYCQPASGVCLYDCTDDLDCPAGFGCSSRGRCQRACQPTNGGREACDGVDNDCDGETDEDLVGQVCVRDNDHGSCSGRERCQAGEWICDAPEPAAEDCNGIDDDCDGATDEELAARDCERRNEHGSCSGLERCEAGGWVCDAPEPAAEDCNGADDDCDGATDEGLDGRACPLTLGVCAGTTRVCDGAAGWRACEYGMAYEAGDETRCDGLDNDCDGATDEDVPPLPACELGAEADDGLDNNCNGLADEPGGCMMRHPFLPLYVDRYEAVVVAAADCSGQRYGQGWIDDYPADWPDRPGPDSRVLYACSLPDVRPSRNLTWHQAHRACLAQGKRLCTKVEWAQACGGSDYLDFPYGQNFAAGRCNSFDTGVGDSLPTGAMPGCVTEGGAYDMSGNLWEWVADDCAFEQGRKAVQGGSYDCWVEDPDSGDWEVCDLDDPSHAESIRWRYHCGWPEHPNYCTSPSTEDAGHGFRCCYEPP
jgi:hypothetical protein